MALRNQIVSFVTLVRRGQLGSALAELGRRLYSNRIAFGLKRDLFHHTTMPAAELDISIRPLRLADVSQLFSSSGNESGEAVRNRIRRLRHINAGISTCYVAVDESDRPLYIQWLMGADENERIQEHFGGEYPELKQDEMLMENLFTVEAHRGRRIMPCALWQIAEIAREQKARRVVAFVGSDNVASLKGCSRAGLRPYLVRHDKWRLFRRYISFEPYTGAIPYPLDTTPAEVVVPWVAQLKSMRSAKMLAVMSSKAMSGK